MDISITLVEVNLGLISPENFVPNLLWLISVLLWQRLAEVVSFLYSFIVKIKLFESLNPAQQLASTVQNNGVEKTQCLYLLLSDSPGQVSR